MSFVVVCFYYVYVEVAIFDGIIFGDYDFATFKVVGNYGDRVTLVDVVESVGYGVYHYVYIACRYMPFTFIHFVDGDVECFFQCVAAINVDNGLYVIFD